MSSSLRRIVVTAAFCLSPCLAQTQRLEVVDDPVSGPEVVLHVDGTPGALAGFLVSDSFGPPIALPFGVFELNPGFLISAPIGVLDPSGQASVHLPTGGLVGFHLCFQSMVFDPNTLSLALTGKGATGHYALFTSTIDYDTPTSADVRVLFDAAPGALLELALDGHVIATGFSNGGPTELRGHYPGVDWWKVLEAMVDGLSGGRLH